VVHSLGQLQPGRDNFVGRSVIFPIRFTISRVLPSARSPGTDTVYIFRVNDGGEFPSFGMRWTSKIILCLTNLSLYPLLVSTSVDAPTTPIAHGSAQAVWADVRGMRNFLKTSELTIFFPPPFQLLYAIHKVNRTRRPQRPIAQGNSVFGLDDPTVSKKFTHFFLFNTPPTTP